MEVRPTDPVDPSGDVRHAFDAEARALVQVMLALPEADYGRPTPCPPWTVRDLLAHVRTIIGRLLDMLAASAPPRAEVDVAGYYGPGKFTAAVDAARLDGARQEAAAAPSGRAVAEDLDRTWRAVRAAVDDQPPGRVVRTRHGDSMELDEFLVTRVVELGVHGLDLAAALDRAQWLTPSAAAVIERLLLSGGGAGRDRSVLTDLEWDPPTFIAKATGRAPLTLAERAMVGRSGLRWLSLSPVTG